MRCPVKKSICEVSLAAVRFRLILEAIESLVPDYINLGEGGNEMVRGWFVGIEL